MIILCDVDQVVADLHAAWLPKYNKLADDHLTIHELVEWDITKFVRKGYENIILDILWDQWLYDKVPLIQGASWGVQTLKAMGHRVVFVTSGNEVSTGQKMVWLQRHGFLPKKRNSFMDFCGIQDKSLVYGDVMIDDGPENITTTRVKYPIVFDWPWNRHIQNVRRADNWTQVIVHVAKIEELEKAAA